MPWVELDFETGKPKRRETPEERDARLAKLEPARLARRKKAREKLAEVELVEQRLKEVKELLEAVEQRKEELAAEHQQRVAPWQEELAKVEREQLQRVRDKRDPDKQLNARRRELLDQIRVATCELEQDVAEEDRLYRELAQERYELGIASAQRIEWEGELRLTARYDLQLALSIASHESDRAFAYASACRDRYEADPSEFWAGVLAIAEKDLAAKQAACKAAFQAIMDE